MSSTMESPDASPETLAVQDSDMLEGRVREHKRAAPGNAANESCPSVGRLDADLVHPISNVVHYEDHHRHDPEKQSTLAAQTVPASVYVSF